MNSCVCYFRGWVSVRSCIYVPIPQLAFGESAFLCLHCFLSMSMFISTFFIEGRTPTHHQTLLFTDGETELPGTPHDC